MFHYKKPVVFIISAALLLTAGWLWTTKDQTTSKNTVINKYQNAKPDRPGAYITKDSDNDGIPDWEEGLYGLDPNNPDTDGDGVSDKEEIEERQQSFLLRKDDEENVPEGNPTLIELREAKQEENIKAEESQDVDVFIHRIEPPTASPGDQITIHGEGFMENGNTIYAGYDVLYSQPSEDGETIKFTFNPDISDVSGSATRTPKFPLWMYVKNTNGLSNVGTLQMRVQ